METALSRSVRVTGFEPAPAVLETAVLTINTILAGPCRRQGKNHSL